MKIYLKYKKNLYTFYTVKLSESGLYIHDNSSKGDHFSYHKDGTCFIHSLGKRLHKRIRKPLKQFEGIESLSCVNMDILDFTKLQKVKSVDRLNENDFVIERTTPFCFELILSNSSFVLPELSGRIDSEYCQKKIGHLYLTLEIFNRTTKHLATLRYQPNEWVIGENAFDWIDEKWQ
jgi:hypothetical protein